MPLSFHPWISHSIHQLAFLATARHNQKSSPQGSQLRLTAGFVLLLAGLVIATSSVAGTQSILPAQNLAFEPNQGQAHGNVAFLARGKGYLIYLRPTEAVVALRSPSPGSATPKPLRMRLLNTAAHPAIAGESTLPGHHNYYVGNDPTHWHTNIPTYAKVAATGVYPGIDMVYYGKEGQLEYDFMVAAGADPRAIRMRFDGADKLQITRQGELLITTGKARLIQHPPYAYQRLGNKQVPVTARYILKGRTVSLDLGAYDRKRPLVIDPALTYSSYLGGPGDDVAQAVAVDSSGNIYITGMTQSTDSFPVKNNIYTFKGGTSDAFVTMLNSSGTVVFSTYLGSGGTVDSGFATPERGTAIAIHNGKIYVTGGTASLATSNPFPTLNPYQSICPITGYAVFVSILNTDGSLDYSTCVGNGTGQEGTGIAVDDVGNAYVVGWTTANNFPVTPDALQSTKKTDPNLRDSFFFKLDPTAGSNGLLYSTYLGSTVDNSVDTTTLCCNTYATAVAVDSNRMAYVAGWTNNTTVGASGVLAPAFEAALTAAGSTYSGGKDAFFYKIDPSAMSPILYASYLGGSYDDTATGIAIAPSASGDPAVYLSGQTGSPNFHVMNAYQSTFGGGLNTAGDAFVAKFSSAANSQYTLSYSTYLGGSDDDGAEAIAVDTTTGRAYVTGSTTSSNFPIQSAGSLQATRAAGAAKDAFVSSLDFSGSTLSLHYSTYLGGELDDQAHGIAYAVNDKAYVVGSTASLTFPVTSNATQQANHSTLCTDTQVINGTCGLLDAFIARIAPVANLNVIIAAYAANDLTNTLPRLGDPLTYSVVVANSGPDAATGITLSIDLAAPTDPGSTTPLDSPTVSDSACVYDSVGKELFTCQWADLAVGGQKTVTISGILSTQKEVVATVTAKSNELEPPATTTYAITADQNVPPPATIVTGGGNTPTPSNGGGGGGGGGGAVGPLALLFLAFTKLARTRIGYRRPSRAFGVESRCGEKLYNRPLP